MKVRKVLLDLARVVADQAERDPVFAEQIAVALGLSDKHGESPAPKRAADAERPKNRRPAAVLDPIALAREGEATLRSRLSALSLDQLRDIVADYGMDHGKLVMKWKDVERVAGRIVELSLARAQKGDAFRSE
ncbi:hypothetical protein EDE12_101619 [Methylosinus sp. sav-2]|jgi:hypothetical protein|uniref:hypothetical protein n=1 Tax=Methylosinus sp. sav-2 TaxID=2485168 RepID=UPI0005667F2A|nr:hypothetical protein [Methylosinus sp. sav-2]TDX67078.1 hypothetical protein EDE12_101619 [Methylosinus sp. sav-2]